MRDPLDTFESWLLHRVAQAVEAGDVPASFLMELQAEIQAAKARPQKARHAAAVWQIAELVGVDREQAAEALAAIEAQPTVTRELLLRRIVEAWLEGQRRAHRAGGGARSGEEEGFQEKRRAPRLPVHLPVIGYPLDQTSREIRGTMYNGSAGGMLVGFPLEVAVGSRLRGVIQARAEAVETDCRVVWTRVVGAIVEHGLAFLEPMDRDFALQLARQ